MTSSANNTLDSPIKWAGGKRWLAPLIAKLWYATGQSRVYIDPFTGGGAIPYYLQPEYAFLNDKNKQLMNFHRCLRIAAKYPIQWLTDDSEQLFYQRRAHFNDIITSVDPPGHSQQELAALFYYLNRTCFNGLCRHNKKGEFNVPWGKYKKPRLLLDWEQYTNKRPGSWHFNSTSYDVFLETLGKARHDFIYLDPPYHDTFTEYQAGGFDWDDQVDLVNQLDDFITPIVASNSYTEKTVNLYRYHGYEVFSVYAPRRISANGDRTPAKEMLAIKNIPLARHVLQPDEQDHVTINL